MTKTWSYETYSTGITIGKYTKGCGQSIKQSQPGTVAITAPGWASKCRSTVVHVVE